MSVDLLNLVLGVHGVALPLCFAGLYRYSDRSTLFAKSVGDTDELLLRMRRTVTLAIQDELAPVVRRAGGDPQIVWPSGYVERAVDPIPSDAFKEAVLRFLHARSGALVDYVEVHRARNKWIVWARALSWTVLCLSAWETLCLTVLGFVGTLLGVSIPEAAITWSLVPTVVFVAAFFCCQASLLRQHDVIHDNKINYPEL